MSIVLGGLFGKELCTIKIVHFKALADFSILCAQYLSLSPLSPFLSSTPASRPIGAGRRGRRGAHALQCRHLAENAADTRWQNATRAALEPGGGRRARRRLARRRRGRADKAATRRARGSPRERGRRRGHEREGHDLHQALHRSALLRRLHHARRVENMGRRCRNLREAGRKELEDWARGRGQRLCRHRRACGARRLRI